jgi:hypothetical protein
MDCSWRRDGGALMSRAMNLSLSEAQVRTLCGKSCVSISAMEPLPQGGCHLVCTTGAGADEIGLELKKYLITTPVKRFAFYRA